MRVPILVSLLALASTLAVAQRPTFTLDAETPEGQMLQAAAMEEDEAKKLALYEAFLKQHAGHQHAWWAWAQAQTLYLKAGNHDKVIEAAEAVLATDPQNSPAAYNALQAAEKKKDHEAVLAWSARTAEAARKMLATKKPEDEEEAATWESEADYARQVIIRCEYSLYAAAVAATDPAAVIALAGALEQRHPESQYVPQVAIRHFAALQQLKEVEKSVALAERTLEKDKSNPEMMLAAADYYMQGRKDLEKALSYAGMLAASAETMNTPPGMAAEAWEGRKRTLIGLGHWMQGMVLSEQKKWAPSDEAFRKALPYIAGNDDLLGPAYFFLGLANYNMSRAGKGNVKLRQEAIRFNELCAKIKGPYQRQAAKNLTAIHAGQ
jgi:tetratricopeptide (TPR) repeat protein